MAQSGYTPIQIYSSNTLGASPTSGNLVNSTLGSELAINITDGKLFYKDNGGAVQVIAWKTTPTSAGGTGLTSYAAGDLLYYASGTALSKLAIGANTYILTSDGTAPVWAAPSTVVIGRATNLAGGAAGSVPYQTAANTTAMLAIGSAYQALQVNAGGTAPSWQASSTSTLTAQGDLLYASAANTLARLAKNTTATRYLANTGTNNNPAWAQIDLSNGVTGTLPVGNGGTGATTFTAGRVLFGNTTSAINTDGDLFWDNSNKRLGIGTSSPSFQLHVVNAGGNSESVVAQYGTSTRALITAFANEVEVRAYNGTNDKLSFKTGTTQRAIFDHQGAFLVGTGTQLQTVTTPSVQIASSGGEQVVIRHTSATAGRRWRFTCDTNNTVYIIDQDTTGVYIGNNGTSWTGLSDERHKDIIEPITDAISKIGSLRSVIGKFKKDQDGVRRSFLIAQDVDKVLPEAVDKTNPDQIGLRYTEVIPLLVAAINDQQKLIEQLQQKIGLQP